MHEFNSRDGQLVELPLDVLVIDPELQLRRSPSASEITNARVALEHHAIVSLPTVSRFHGRWRLVSGEVWVSAWRAAGIEKAAFRIVDGSAADLLLIAVADHLGRRELTHGEVVTALERLHHAGVDAQRIATACNRSRRWVRELTSLRRSAHPELWRAFEQGTRGLTLRRMIALVDRPSDQQLDAWRTIDAALQGRAALSTDGPIASRVRAPKRRKRSPLRRHVLQLLRIVEVEASLSEEFRKGALAVLHWLLFRVELPVQPSLATLLRIYGAAKGTSEPPAPLR